jgi:Transglycosylase SLT domain
MPPLLRLWRSFIPSKSSVWSQVTLAVGCLVAIVVAGRLARPFYVGREPIGAQLIEHEYVDSSELRAPWMHRPAEVALKSPRFLLDRELFAMDLLRTGHVTVKRAWALADVAVREAYTRRVPPALVLGVMLTENDELKSSARSRVGAIGLMQVYPKHWAGSLGRKFGTNIRTDSTNLKYGIFILGWVMGRAVDKVDDRDGAWRTALLSYNGCVKGTNTPNCSAYPDVVRRQVQENAKSSCRGDDFDRCVVEPLWLARRAGTGDAPATNAVVASGAQAP